MRTMSIRRGVLAGIAAGVAIFKAQAHTADLLRELMAARGLSTEGHVVDPLVCLDCYQTRPDQVRDAVERDRRMAAELAAAVRDGKDD